MPIPTIYEGDILPDGFSLCLNSSNQCIGCYLRTHTLTFFLYLLPVGNFFGYWNNHVGAHTHTFYAF